MQQFTRRAAAAVIVAAMALMTTSLASADDVVTDGDGVQPVSTHALALGNVCANSTVTKDVLLAVTRQSNGTNVFKNGSTATMSVGTITGSGLSAVVPSPQPPGGTNTITIPSNWDSAAFGTLTSSVASRVTYVAGAAGTTLSGSISYAATGTNASNGAVTRATPLTVTATVVSCDATPPVLNLPANVTVEATSAAGRAVTFSASATDANPANPSVTCAPTSGSTFPLGTTTVSCSSTDAAGNTANGSFTITVRDTTGPAMSGTPTDITTEATSASGALVTFTPPTATDLVDGSRPVTCTPASGSVLPIGANTVSCSASDLHGNTSSSSFVVTVADSTAPSLTLPGPITSEATSAAGATVDYTATALDTVDGAVTPTCTPPSGSTFALGTSSVDCSASDAHGNGTSGSFTVTVVDTTAPTITVPASFSVEATGPGGASVPFTVTATDLVDGAVTPTCSPASGSTFPLDSTTVTCTAKDAHGNTSSESFTVTVVDTTAPVLSLPADVVIEADSSAGHTVTYSATALDIVDGSVATSCSSPSGSAFAVGVTTVTCSAEDAHGNKATGSFTVTVTDTTPPALTLPGDSSVEAAGPGGAAFTYTAAADDIVDGTVAVTCNPPSGSTFALGTTTVDCSATDAHGNTATGSFTVSVVDTTPPTLTLPASIDATATSASGAPVTYNASATDTVDGTDPVSCNPPSGSTFALGTTTVACSATDAHGNSATGQFVVTVSFDLSGGLLQPVNPSALNTVKGGSTVPLKWQVRSPEGGYITSTAIVSSFVVTQVNCAALTEATDAVDFTTTGGTTLRYDGTANQFIQNWQTPKRAGTCYRVDIRFVGGQKLSANFQLK